MRWNQPTRKLGCGRSAGFGAECLRAKIGIPLLHRWNVRGILKDIVNGNEAGGLAAEAA